MSPELRERIEQLSREIETTPRYPHRSHKLNLTRGDYRVAVSVCHGRTSGFYGSARIGKNTHSSWAKTPGDAIAKIITHLGWTISRLEHERGVVPSVATTV